MIYYSPVEIREKVLASRLVNQSVQYIGYIHQLFTYDSIYSKFAKWSPLGTETYDSSIL